MRTIAGVLADALGRAARLGPGTPVKLTVAGRTDAGVHAVGQVVHVDVPGAWDEASCRALRHGINARLAPEVVVAEVSVTGAAFDARRSAMSREYRYYVLNGEVEDPFLAATSWYVRDPLDLPAMRLACDALIGEHDFSAFCRRPRGSSGPLAREVLRASWGRASWGRASRDGAGCTAELLVFRIEATSFCHQMVRSIVGMMVRIGRHKLRAADVLQIMASGDRSRAGAPAPPAGLFLMRVSYGEEGR